MKEVDKKKKKSVTDDMDTTSKDDVTVIETDKKSKNGQDKCPKCGSTDISPVSGKNTLRCNFCRHVFKPEKLEGMITELDKLEGQVITSGAKDIAADAKDVVTLKCTSCGAEVVIDTASSMQARCHWCRNTLSLNEQIPNGSVPDVVLPFSIQKDVAREEIEKFVGKRKFFANPKFKKEFTTENIMGVYFPYMLVDVNSHASFSGEGEHQTRRYTVGTNDNRRTYYDADLYHVERDFDLTIEGLSIESNSDRLNTESKEKTNNIINAIMPFDTENCIKYKANYLKGYTSEKRDTNVKDLKKLVDIQAKDIARFAANDTLKQYDRGVKWSKEEMNIKGQQWKAAYLPVWLYSYQEVKKNKKLLHYVAVNARTKETMGSVPIHIPKLTAISIMIEFLGILAMIFVDWDYKWSFLLAGFIYFFIIYTRYRNSNARHTYETDTKKEVTNLKKVDNFVRSEKGLSYSYMNGANNKKVEGKNSSAKLFDSMTANKMSGITDTLIKNDTVGNFIKNNINKK